MRDDKNIVELKNELLNNLKTLKFLYDLGLKMFLSVVGKKTRDWEKAYGGVIFSKILSHLEALLKLLYDSSHNCFDSLHRFNFPSVAVLTRVLMESYLFFYYLLIDEIPEEIRLWRKRISEFDAYDLRIRILKKPKCEWGEIHLLRLSEDFERFKEHEIQDFKYFEELKKSESFRKIKNEIAMKAGIDSCYHKCIYHFLSRYVHVDILEAGVLTRSNEFELSKVVSSINFLVEVCLNFTSYALRDFVKLFPELQPMIEDEIFQEILKRSVYLMEGGWKEDAVD